MAKRQMTRMLAADMRRKRKSCYCGRDGRVVTTYLGRLRVAQSRFEFVLAITERWTVRLQSLSFYCDISFNMTTSELMKTATLPSLRWTEGLVSLSHT